MDLREYLTKNKITQKKFANFVGISESKLSLILIEKQIPFVSEALLIERATEYQVSAIEILRLDEKNRLPQ
jgi:transcriptional regulator with XRE-family HTH domain